MEGRREEGEGGSVRHEAWREGLKVELVSDRGGVASDAAL